MSDATAGDLSAPHHSSLYAVSSKWTSSCTACPSTAAHGCTYSHCISYWHLPSSHPHPSHPPHTTSHPLTPPSPYPHPTLAPSPLLHPTLTPSTHPHPTLTPSSEHSVQWRVERLILDHLLTVHTLPLQIPPCHNSEAEGVSRRVCKEKPTGEGHVKVTTFEGPRIILRISLYAS